MPGSCAGFHAHPLVLTYTIQDGELHVGALHDEEYIAPALADRLLHRLHHVLRILQCLYPSAVREPEPARIDVLLSGHAQDRPAAQAVVSFHRALACLELEALASRLASEPGAVAPLLFGNSMWTVVAMLGVLNATQVA
ncbi:hypothetical protein B0J12DRAFT_741009 [Macrophomina phaseolina]|uniref:Uncharacterized protein n=1 Tax=Macrophomina phaseolina TaxID=35725 RepID=A0ABQ8G9B8_9PEZI|nr:hypothetical protein B0J12DRAFT_741009 [Macrophomina phaseolina]